uniref:Uncharacterized protein n=1 Tax=Oryza brachyantha TaxID=4533 RepID=J3LYV1_ORYBR
GSGGIAISTAPSSICVTLCMVGRMAGSSWMHQSATARNLCTLLMSNDASSSPSTSKSILPER